MTSKTELELAALVRPRISDQTSVPKSESEFVDREFDTMGLDSLDYLELIMEIEDKNEFLLDENKVIACKTIGALAALVDATKTAKD